MHTVGIDLGTTFSSVGIFENGKVTIINNDDSILNPKTTPSYVAFTDDCILVGEPAKDYITTKPKNVVYDSKRLIGKTFDNENVQNDLKNWPFEITNVNNKPNIKLMYKNKAVEYQPKFISAQILIKLKDVALRYLNSKEKLNAVITVPAYFNQSERKETTEAAKIAGIEVLQLLNEPTAASIAYGFDKIFETEKIILCFDFGGGTLDVSIVSIKNGDFNVLATSGDTHLGGQDIDNALCNYVIRLMNEKYNIDVRTLENKDEVKYLIKNACEIAKRRLTTNETASIQERKLCKYANGADFNLDEKIRKSKFESIVSGILDKTLESVKAALALANLEKNKIEEIVMVGGSSKIPYVQNLLETFFGKKVKNDIVIDRDLAIAYGAAIYASKFNTTNSFVNLSINEVLPLSVGVKIRHDEFYTIISRGTKIPCTNTECCENMHDNQEAIKFEIYEGERARASDNYYLGEFEIKIEPSPRRQAKVFLTLKIDKSGIITFEAKYKNIKRLLNLEINYNAGKINKMLNDAEIFEETDLLIREACKVIRELENYSDEMKTKAISFRAKNETETQKILELIEYLDKIYKWCVQDPICEKEKYEKELITCKSKCLFLSDQAQ